MASSDYGYGADPSYYGDYTGGYTGTMSGGGGAGGPPTGGGGMRGGGAGGQQGGGHGGAAAYGYGYGGMGHGGYGEPTPSPLDAEIQVVCREIQTELHTLEQSGDYGEQFKNARRLLTTGIAEANKLENNIDPEWLEVDINKPIKVTKKVLIPSFRHPKFNFVGKVLGPKGATLQNIAKHFKCHVYILGRGSTRDRAKEQELLQSGDPQFAHYGGPLHVKVETTAAPAIAYQRVAGVLDVLTQLLVPVKDTHIEGITTVGEGGAGGDKDGDDPSKQDGSDEGGPADENGGGAPKNGGAPGGYRGGGMRGGPPRGGGGGGGFRGSFGGGGPGRGAPRGGGGGFRGGPGGGSGRGGPRGGGPGGPMRGGHRGGPRGGGFKPY